MSRSTRLQRRKGGTGSLLAAAGGGTPAEPASTAEDQGLTDFSENTAQSSSSQDQCDLEGGTPSKKTRGRPKKGSAKPNDTRDARNFQKILTEQNRDVVEWWDARSSLGPKPLIIDADALWSAAKEYFRWNEEHPLWEEKVFAYKGEATREPVAKVRAMTVTALCHFLDIPSSEWEHLRKNPELLPAVTRIEEVIFNQKLQGAAATLLDGNIVARDLQLKDHKEHSGPGASSLNGDGVPSLELAKAIALILRRGVEALDTKTVNGEIAPDVAISAPQRAIPEQETSTDDR